MRSLLRVLVATSFVLVVVALVAAWLISRDFEQRMAAPVFVPEQHRLFTIGRGEPFKAVAARLAAIGVFDRPLYLRFEARRTGVDGQLQAGEYYLDDSASIREVIEKFVRGEVLSYAITLIEGQTVKQYLAQLSSAEALRHELQGVTPATLLAQLELGEGHAEGRFLPETYRHTRDTSDADLLLRAYRMMEETLAEEWAARAPDLPYESAYDALIMASIIEKETGLAAERAKIAGVFVRRLRRGVRLQTDPTVIYGLGESFDGNLRRADLQRDTPYNTYTRSGLPPTPIASAGRAAIHAALHPAAGKALYFVARGDGSHQFSATLAEHNKAVRKYQLGGGR
ncbi:MAG: endolytic transglycosylase MltG [Gammaproteobacteria bacterium]|nr:endolytic transglycosylase MltG [Gammaproteobacteria bacterium]NNM01121.1 endolytic transglycosylase MltG [Gammaproteobacteria bacterium]